MQEAKVWIQNVQTSLQQTLLPVSQWGFCPEIVRTELHADADYRQAKLQNCVYML